MTYIGNYDNHECKIELSNVGLDDAGTWTCDMESYVSGDHISGYQVKRNVELIVFSNDTQRCKLRVLLLKFNYLSY